MQLVCPSCGRKNRVPEAERVLQAMASHGLERGVNGLEIYVMCEIPNNVIQIDAFARLFDGFSIGSNDLTFDFDQRDEGVKAMIRQTIEGARRNRRHVTPDTLLEVTREVLAVEQRLGRAPRGNDGTGGSS